MKGKKPSLNNIVPVEDGIQRHVPNDEGLSHLDRNAKNGRADCLSEPRRCFIGWDQAELSGAG